MAQRNRPEMGCFNFSFEILVRAENPLAQTRQRNRAVAEPAELLSGDVTLVLPERVQHSNQRRALSGKVVQIQQLESPHPRRAQSGFNFLLVAQRLKLA